MMAPTVTTWSIKMMGGTQKSMMNNLNQTNDGINCDNMVNKDDGRNTEVQDEPLAKKSKLNNRKNVTRKTFTCFDTTANNCGHIMV